MSERPSLLEIESLEILFPGADREMSVVTGVDLAIQEGEFFGLIGETGAGKSLTAWSAIDLVPPPGRISHGEVRFMGRSLRSLPTDDLRRIRGAEIGLIVQNARGALNPLLPIGTQLANAHRSHNNHVSKAVGWGVAIEALRSVGLDSPERSANLYPHQLSGGMAQRVLIAMALINSPRLVIADEPTTGLDVTLQAEILDLLTDLVRRTNCAVWIITHDLGIVANYTERVAVMFAGEIVESTSTRALFTEPRHPYTIGLVEAFQDRGEALAVSGPAPNLATRPAGCQFSYRCPWAEAAFEVEKPALTEVVPGHHVRCFVAQRRAIASDALAGSPIEGQSK